MLTIAIPTYNRACCLAVLLQSVSRQSVPTGEVEVLISDNASEDDTRQVVEGFEVQNPQFSVSYYRNASNVGFSNNVDLAIRRARGAFVMLMGDDDALETDALRRVLEDVTRVSTDVCAILTGVNVYSQDLSSLVREAGVPSVPVEEVAGVDLIRRRRSFAPALVSGYVFRRADWVSFPSGKYCDSIQVHALRLNALLLTRRCLVDHRAIVRYRADAVGGTWSRDPLYPYRYHLDSLAFCRDVRPRCPRGIYRCWHRSAVRQFIFSQMQQKVWGVPADEKGVWRLFCASADFSDWRTWAASALRYCPNSLMRLLFGRLVRARTS